MAFGLAGALPAAFMIKAGLHPADAYSFMVMLWLLVGFFGAYCIAVMQQVKKKHAILLAVFWLTSINIWSLEGWSMVAIGMMLLPTYLVPIIKITQLNLTNRSQETKYHFCFVLTNLIVCVISIFMDGYSFVFFVFGSFVILIFNLYRNPRLLQAAYFLIIHFVCLVVAYLLYSKYIGKSYWNPVEVPFSSTSGVDLSYIIIPTHGLLWFFDMIGLSVQRSIHTHFGDWSVFNTTFALPIIVFGLCCFYQLIKHNSRLKHMTVAFLLIALFGIYMVLGSDLRFFATRPLAGEYKITDFTIIKTGSYYLYEFLPVLKVMRVIPRWVVLNVFGFWLILTLYFSSTAGKIDKGLSWKSVILILLIIMNLPNMKQQFQDNRFFRDNLLRIDKELVSSLAAKTHKGDVVAFVPFQNDIIVNYVASRLNIKAYNIGGDKNLKIAQNYWPKEMLALSWGNVYKTNEFAFNIASLLKSGKADIVVISYVDLLQAANLFPSFRDVINPPTGHQILMAKETHLSWPDQVRKGNGFPGLLKLLIDNHQMKVEDGELFAVIKR